MKILKVYLTGEINPFINLISGAIMSSIGEIKNITTGLNDDGDIRMIIAFDDSKISPEDKDSAFVELGIAINTITNKCLSMVVSIREDIGHMIETHDELESLLNIFGIDTEE